MTRPRRAVAAVAALLLATSPGRADLALEAGFGNDGLSAIDFAARIDSARDAAVQADGRVVVAGFARQAPAGTVHTYAGVARLLADGSLDDSFGTDGRVALLPGGTPAAAEAGADARAVRVQPDQSILLAGQWGAGGGAAAQVFVLRLTPAGDLDPGFAADGVLILDVPGLTDAIADDIALQADGSIIVTGAGEAVSGATGFVLRLTPAGLVDTGFGAGGAWLLPSPDPNARNFGLRAVEVLADDRIIALGGDPDIVVALLGADGDPDAGFGSLGVATVDVAALRGVPARSTDDAFGITRQADGRIVVAGYTTPAGEEDSLAVLVRFLPDGSVDADFGEGGALTIPATGVFPTAFDVVAQADDTLVTGGAGIPLVQVSANGLAQFPLRELDDNDFVIGLANAPGDRVVAVGQGQGPAVGEQPGTRDFLVGLLAVTPLVDEADTTPDPFTFVDTPDEVPPGTFQESPPVTITGLRSPAPVTVTGGTYSIDGGPDTNAPGLIQDGQTVRLRHQSSFANGGTADTTLNIGGVEDTFTSVTRTGTVEPFELGAVTGVPRWTFQQSQTITVAGLAPNTLTSISVAGDPTSAYSLGCTGTFTSTVGVVANGAQVCVRHVSSTAGNTLTETTLFIGGTSGTFRSTTEDVDATPDAFAFPSLVDAPIDAPVTTAPVTITGIGNGVDVLVQVANGQYSIGCTGLFQSGFATIRNGQTVCVRHQSAGVSQGTVTTTLTIGTVSASFTSTTVAADLVPDTFSFAPVEGVELLATVESAPATITGLTGPATVAVSGASGSAVSIGCTGNYTASPPRIGNGETLCVRHSASGESEGIARTSVQIGGRAAVFRSTARVADLVPEPFTFPPVGNQALADVVTSAIITVSGIDGPAPIRVDGPPVIGTPPLRGWSINCEAPYSGDPGVVRNGDRVCVAIESATTDDTPVTATLRIGPPGAEVTADFVVTTGDTTPDPLVFVPRTGVRQETRVTSSPVSISGITAPALISIDINGEYSIGCSGGWTRADGRVEAGDRVCVRHASAPTLSATVETTLYVGGAWSCNTGFLTAQNGRAVCVGFTGVPIVGALRRNGEVSDTFRSTTAEESFPGSSALEPWTLGGLAVLALARRRRRLAAG